MQFAEKTPPTFLAVLFVTFFPLQGFFTLVVYMFPRILRYFEKGTLIQSWKRKLFSSSKNNVSNNNVPKKPKSQTKIETHVSDGRIVEDGESGAAPLEVEVDHGHEDEKEREGVNGNNAKGEENSGDDRTWDGEKDAIDELEDIVDLM